jgi:tRNA(Ile)-lysidine synthase
VKRAAHPPRDWPAKAARVGEALPPDRLHPEAWAVLHAACSARRRARVAVAFSGGADSLVLLLALWAHFPAARERLVALHFNHRLRGRAAGADERFCARVAGALKLNFVSARWTSAPLHASEAHARTARLAFFAREMSRRRIGVLALGHQQDDILETWLMRLARGSGTAGLAAPRPVQKQSGNRVHVRPLLTLRKTEIVALLRSLGTEWREDATNGTDEFLRNRVRRTIIPALAKASGRDVWAAAALARERLQEDDEALEAWLDEVRPLATGRTVLRLDRLQDKPRALWRRALHRWLMAAAADTDLSRAGFEQLLKSVMAARGTRFSLGKRSFAVVRGGQLLLEPR